MRLLPCAVPSYPTNGPTFLDSQIAALIPKSGYSRIFDSSAVVLGGLSCFVYETLPVTAGRTGVRGFAADCGGLICQSPDGSALPFAGGRLTGPCTPVR